MGAWFARYETFLVESSLLRAVVARVILRVLDFAIAAGVVILL
jgi:hypothetical protein